MSAPTTMGSPNSGPSLSHSEFPKSLTVLFEIRGRVVEDFVLLEKGIDPASASRKQEADEAVQRSGRATDMIRARGSRALLEADPSTSTRALRRDPPAALS